MAGTATPVKNAHPLWTFHGGLRLPGHKRESTAQPIDTAALPAQLVVPLHQHLGTGDEPLVKVGERVLKGQLLAQSSEYVSAPVHTPTSGTVRAIEPRRFPHPSGLPASCVVIDTDGREEWTALEPFTGAVAELEPVLLRARVRAAGIVGLGGAGFPTHVKLNPRSDVRIDTLIINGAECEPYITCDEMLMRERAHEVVEGAILMRHAVQAQHCLIGLEDNKPEARDALIRALAAADESGIRVVEVPTRYPAGGERQLIKVLTGREVPSQGLPLEIGVVCHNVGTAAAVYRAVRLGQPLISRIVTVTGPGIAQPRNVEALIGTPVHALIEQCGGYTMTAPWLRMGGPMMGNPLPDDTLPVIKTCNCILVTEQLPTQPERPCIRCGECVRVCPANLLPQQLHWHARAKEFDKVQDYHLFDCIECGCCDYVCPSHIPLVSHFRYAKTEIWAQDKERRKADLARRRHEARQARQERDKGERAARLQKHRPETTAAAVVTADPVQAAVERVKMKQEGGME